MSSPAPATLESQAVADAVEKHSYRQILKSSALIGGSQVANIAIGIVRTKVMAVLLGPAGVGLAGLYGSISDLTLSIAGMGVNSSGVRQIAEAAGSDDTERITRTSIVLRRMSILLGVLGAVLLLVFSRPVSTLTFGNDQHAEAVSLLSVAVFFRLVSAGQGALINGMRRISDLAKMNVLGALSGTAICLPVVYVLREDGIVLSLIVVAAMTYLTSWWYSRKIHMPSLLMTASQIGQEAGALLKLGAIFMITSLMGLGSAYLIRITLRHRLGIEATGLYQAAWALGGLYVGWILQAMGADFYPRLTASASDNTKCNHLVNEQTRIGLLLAGPGVIATLTFAPVVLVLFYRSNFGPAAELLRWVCLGVLLRVISWPMSFIIVAKGARKLFFFTDLAWVIVHLGLAWACIEYFGLNGAGIAFFGSYVFHAGMLYPVVQKLSGFQWSSENKHTGLLFLSLIGIVFLALALLPNFWAVGIGTLAIVVSSAYSIRVLLTFISSEQIPRPVRRLLAVCSSFR